MLRPGAPGHAIRALRAPAVLNRYGSRRWQHTKPFDAAVIGGGITGLTAAYRLSRDPNCSKITLYEESSEVGGWMRTRKIPHRGGEVYFEEGPRTLRTAVPTCLPLMDLIFDLGLEEDVVMTEKTAPAALNRYIYYPDHLVRMPSPIPNADTLQNAFNLLRTVWREPVFETLLSSFFLEPLKPPGPRDRDESVGDFISRRLSPQMAENLVSAVYHGIYAGDINELSADTLLPAFRHIEKGGEGLVRGMMDDSAAGIKHMLMDDMLALETLGANHSSRADGSYLKSLVALVKNSSVLTFRKGMGQLPQALLEALMKSDKFEYHSSSKVTGVTQDPHTSDITIRTDNTAETHNRVISTIPPKALAQALNTRTSPSQPLPDGSIRHLSRHNKAVTVKVVNLWYDNPDLLDVRGFGYLLPQSVPFEQNPERALGVIFASETCPGQDSVPGTKLTVMMGGHWWAEWDPSEYPDDEEAGNMAQAVLARHLGIQETPSLVESKLMVDAIPQYTVGHLERMKDLSHAVREEFNHRLTLAGAWYNGVGVVDCIRQGYMAASYGVGTLQIPRGDSRDRSWKMYNYENWDLEGGIPTAEVRMAQSYRSERRHFQI